MTPTEVPEEERAGFETIEDWKEHARVVDQQWSERFRRERDGLLRLLDERTKERDEARAERDDLIESRDLLLADENLSPLLRDAIRGYFITSIATAKHLLEGPGEK